MGGDIIRWQGMPLGIAQIGIVMFFQKRFGETAVGLRETHDCGALRIATARYRESAGKINPDAAALENIEQRTGVMRRGHDKRIQFAVGPWSYSLFADFVKSLQPPHPIFGSVTQQSESRSSHVVRYVFQVPLAASPHRTKLFRSFLR